VRSLALHHEGTKDTKAVRDREAIKHGTSNKLLLLFFVAFVPFVPSW